MKRRMRMLLPLLRAIPPGTRGKHRLARRLLGRALDDTDVRILARDGTSYRVPSVRASIGFSLLVDGVYEPDEIALVLSLLAAGDCFIDVGANIGCFAIPAGRRVAPGGRVLAIEGSPTMRAILERNLAENAAAGVEVLACLALDRDGAAPFHEAPPEKFGMGSVAVQFDLPPLELPCRRIDTLLAERGIDRVAVMKVDVEGFESAVFAGASRLLTGPRPPVIVFEFVDWAEGRALGRIGDAQEMLRGWGYSVWTLAAFRRRGKPLGAPLRMGAATLVAMREVAPQS